MTRSKFKLHDRVISDGRPGTIVNVAAPLRDFTRNYLILYDTSDETAIVHENSLEPLPVVPKEADQ